MARKGLAGTQHKGYKKGTSRRRNIYEGLTFKELQQLNVIFATISSKIGAFSTPEREFYNGLMRRLEKAHFRERVISAQTLVCVIESMRTYSNREHHFFERMLADYKGLAGVDKIRYADDLNRIILRSRASGSSKDPSGTWEEDTIPQ